MPTDKIEEIVRMLFEKKINPEEAIERLKFFPTEDLGFAHLDHHRSIRQGFPEVVYCEGKSDQDVEAIIKRLIDYGTPVLATRATREVFGRISKLSEKAKFHERSRTITIDSSRNEKIGSVLIVSAGTSDIPVAEEAAVTASIMGSEVNSLYDVGVAGIHRLFHHIDSFKEARVIVVVAGMDGALASVVGGLVDRPVVAVPTSIGYGAAFGGVAALLSMLNSCATGVAVMNIDNGFGAGALAHKINAFTENLKKKRE